VRVVGLITARGGSKGIPRKNIAPVAGLPLIAWTVRAALGARTLDRVIVSTDDGEIAAVCRRHGAESPFLRPAELASDTAAHIDVVEHALAWLKADEGRLPDYVLTLQPTSPLRTAEDIDAAVALAERTGADAVLGVTEARHHLHFALRLDGNGRLQAYGSAPVREMRRQDLPAAFVPNGAIYLNRSAALLESRSMMPPGSFALVMPPARSLDIDEPWDLQLAGLVLAARESGGAGQA
jgi:CMP-N,N'-diacetyllegionaminic acid synthase